jgi:hypothetical protein
MNKYNIEEIHEYLKTNWYDSELLSDFNMAIDSGFTDYAAYLIYCSGGLSSNIQIEKCIIDLMLNYNPNVDLNECFKNAVVFKNKLTNECVFVKNDYVDYLLTLNDMGDSWEELK